MRSLHVLPRRAAVVALVVAAAGCGAGEPPGWTYQPAPAATPRPSIEASGEPSPGATPTAVPTATESAAASASAEASPGGAVVQLVAVDATGWETPEISAPADSAFTLEFDNRDPTAPHNVAITNPDGSTVDIGDTTPFTGPEVRDYEVPALAAGEYPFLCQVHPTTMTGTLTVE